MNLSATRLFHSFFSWCIFLSISTFFACQTQNNTPPTEQVNPYASISDEKARAIIQKAIEHAGGLEKWRSIKHLRYTKNFALLDAAGATEKSFQQVHDYDYSPLKIDIQSEENGEQVHTVFENNTYKRYKNDSLLDKSQASLTKAVNSSLYVLGMPFKLLDAGADIVYEGKDTLDTGVVTDVLRVSYDADKHDNHSSTEIWRYYFDQIDGKIVANWVHSSDHANIVDNLSFERVNGLLFHKDRKSYRLDSLGNKAYLRASYSYGNYELEFE